MLCKRELKSTLAFFTVGVFFETRVLPEKLFLLRPTLGLRKTNDLRDSLPLPFGVVRFPLTRLTESSLPL
jgi:hypothetical protein